MPVKRRIDKMRRWRISPEAAARWRVVRPHGLRISAGGGFVDDDALGDLIGQPSLIAMPLADMEELRDALEEAIG